jgi:hypothetical protein
MQWVDSVDERGWVGEDGYKVLLIDFLPRTLWVVCLHDKKLADFDAIKGDGLGQAKAFAERHRAGLQ